MYQAALDVGAIVEVKIKNSRCLHKRSFSPPHFRGIHLFCLLSSLASLKNQQPVKKKKMRVMCNCQWKSPNARLPGYSGLDTNLSL